MPNVSSTSDDDLGKKIAMGSHHKGPQTATAALTGRVVKYRAARWWRWAIRFIVLS